MISIVVPVFNEEDSIENYIKNLDRYLNFDYEVIFACDPSTDNTEKLIQDLNKRFPKKFKGLFMSRRFGQHNCIIAGLNYAKGNAVVVMDVDGQDPVEILPKMIEKWNAGFDVVYAKRGARKNINIINRLTSKIALFIISKISYINIPRDVGEYRLMDRKVVDEVVKMNEAKPFLRGMVSYVGFKQTGIDFDRPKREHGKTKYNKLFGSLSFGVIGLTSFSEKLLFLSFFAFLITFIASIYTGLNYLFFQNSLTELSGLASLILIISSIHFLCLTILGVYINNIYFQVLNRKQYIISKFIGDF